jgi:arabinogalactan endo-1,4-beta-galactosidase
MLHLAEGGSNGTFTWWFGNVTSRDVPFDVIGASYYGYWHGTLAALQFNLNDVTARYTKDIIVVETAYAFTLEDDDGWGNIIGDPSQLVPGYPATPEGQAANFRDVMSIVRAVPNGRGLGAF